jgi:hypothetical protein
MAEFNPKDFSGNMEQNPLKKFFRQPKIYITLPSKGKFYSEGALDLPENGEIPVFAMTAKDELAIKTPDALLNGQATVDIINSCVPNIRDPWQMPSIDLDAVLVAIRIATYGEDLEIETKIPNVGEDRSFKVDLRQVLNKLVVADFDNIVKLKDMTVELKPLTYREFTNSNLKTFEEQRIFALVNDDTADDSVKLEKFSQSFKKLTELTMSMLTQSISKITVGDTEVSNPVHIKEFVDNVDKEFFKDITDHLNDQRDAFSIEPFKVTSSAEDIEKGAPETWEVPITFDQSNFFG